MKNCENLTECDLGYKIFNPNLIRYENIETKLTCINLPDEESYRHISIYFLVIQAITMTFTAVYLVRLYIFFLHFNLMFKKNTISTSSFAMKFGHLPMDKFIEEEMIEKFGYTKK